MRVPFEEIITDCLFRHGSTLAIGDPYFTRAAQTSNWLAFGSRYTPKWPLGAARGNWGSLAYGTDYVGRVALFTSIVAVTSLFGWICSLFLPLVWNTLRQPWSTALMLVYSLIAFGIPWLFVRQTLASISVARRLRIVAGIAAAALIAQVSGIVAGEVAKRLCLVVALVALGGRIAWLRDRENTRAFGVSRVSA